MARHPLRHISAVFFALGLLSAPLFAAPAAGRPAASSARASADAGAPPAAPRADTAFLQIVRRDFQRYDADAGALVPLAPNHFARARWLLVVMEVEVGSVASYLVTRLPDDESVPVLWVGGHSDNPRSRPNYANLRPHHLLLSDRVAQQAGAAARRVYDDFVEAWPAAKRGASAKTPEPRDVAIYARRLESVLPAYWPQAPDVYHAALAARDLPLALLLDRDGRPLRFHDQLMLGPVDTLAAIIQRHADEIR